MTDEKQSEVVSVADLVKRTTEAWLQFEKDMEALQRKWARTGEMLIKCRQQLQKCRAERRNGR